MDQTLEHTGWINRYYQLYLAELSEVSHLFWQREAKAVQDKVIGRFCRHIPGFWNQLRGVIALFVLALLLDAASTTYFMLEWGSAYEIHPIVRHLSLSAGPWAGPFLGALLKGVLGIVVGIFCRPIAAQLFSVASVIAILAAGYNMWGYWLILLTL